MTVHKEAIIDRADQAALLKACKINREYVPVWLMLRMGIPPAEMAGSGLSVRGNCVFWVREGNAIPRKTKVHPRIAARIRKWIAEERDEYNARFDYIITRVGNRVGHPEYTYQTLLNSNCVNQIREALDEGLSLNTTVTLVADRMGRKLETVQDLYLDFEKWQFNGGENAEREKLGSKEGGNGCDRAF